MIWLWRYWSKSLRTGYTTWLELYRSITSLLCSSSSSIRLILALLSCCIYLFFVISRNEVHEYSKQSVVAVTTEFLQLGASRHLHFYMLWISSILTTHGPALKKTSSQIMSTLNGIVSALTAQTRTLSSLCDSNQYFMDVILTLGKVKSSHTLPSDVDVF